VVGRARDAVTTEMTALGGQMTRFGPMFTAAGEGAQDAGRQGPHRPGRHAQEHQRPLGRRQETYRNANQKATTAYRQTIGDLDSSLTGPERKLAREDADEVRVPPRDGARRADDHLRTS
jgi:hypothetical protein